MMRDDDDDIVRRMTNPTDYDATLIIEVLVEHLIKERGFSIEDLRALLPQLH